MRALSPSTCLLLLTALGGCVGTSDPPLPIPENPNRFTYHTVDYPYAVHFAAASDALSPGEMNAAAELPAKLERTARGQSHGQRRDLVDRPEP